jgi:hypothetical protein
VTEIISLEEVINFTLQVQNKITIGQSGGKTHEFAMLLSPAQSQWQNTHFKRCINVIRSRVEKNFGQMLENKKRPVKRLMWEVKEM